MELNKIILKTQYVINRHTNTTVRVKVGSGMGLGCSGEVSDNDVLQRVEIPFLLLPAVRQRYGILFYGRFKDDALLIATCSLHDLNELLAEIDTRADHFKVTIDEQSSLGVTMLDVKIGRQGQRLSFSPHRKDTAHGRYISSLSYHPSSVHRTWPIQMLNHYQSIASTDGKFRKAAQEFITKLAKDDCEHIALSSLISELHGISLVLPRAEAQGQKTFIVTPFHKVWEGAGFNKILADLYRTWQRSLALVSEGNFLGTFSWRLAKANLASEVAALNFKTGSLHAQQSR